MLGCSSLSLSLSLSLSSKLNPKLTPADQFDIIKASTDSVYPLPSPSALPLNGGKKKQEPLLVSHSIHVTLHKCSLLANGKSKMYSITAFDLL